MWTYTAPLRDMQFVIEDVLEAPAGWREMPAFADLDAGTARQVLEEAGKFASGVLAPINGSADLQGCRWHDGEVRTPDGYRKAYRARATRSAATASRRRWASRTAPPAR